MESLDPEADTLCAAHEPGGHVYGGRGSLWAGLRRELSSRKMPPPRAASGFSRRSQQLDGVGGGGQRQKHTPMAGIAHTSHRRCPQLYICLSQAASMRIVCLGSLPTFREVFSQIVFTMLPGTSGPAVQIWFLSTLGYTELTSVYSFLCLATFLRYYLHTIILTHLRRSIQRCLV